MVKFSDFSSVFGITFALNVFVSYIQEVKKRGSREISSTVTEVLQDYDIKQDHVLYSKTLTLEARVLHTHSRLEFTSNAMSVLTIASSISALGILIYTAFFPDAQVSVLAMSLILLCLLLLPLLTVCTVYLASNMFRRRLSQLIDKLVPQ